MGGAVTNLAGQTELCHSTQELDFICTNTRTVKTEGNIRRNKQNLLPLITVVVILIVVKTSIVIILSLPPAGRSRGGAL